MIDHYVSLIEKDLCSNQAEKRSAKYAGWIWHRCSCATARGFSDIIYGACSLAARCVQAFRQGGSATGDRSDDVPRRNFGTVGTEWSREDHCLEHFTGATASRPWRGSPLRQ